MSCVTKSLIGIIDFMKRYVLYIGIVIALMCIVFGIRIFFKAEPTVEELLFDVPEVEEGLSLNDKIMFSLDTFKDVSKEMKRGYEGLCKDGVIDTQTKVLKQIADDLVSYRILNPYPLEFATTQQEAGIQCVSSKDRFALSIQLNVNDDGKYYRRCIDVLGQTKQQEVDMQKILCK